MDDQRIGRVVRALRRRLGWRQADLGAKANCSQATISVIERGHLENISVPTMRRVAAELDASLVIEVRWRGAALDRLMDEEHAVLVASVVEQLTEYGWEAQVELTYSEFGERGSYDVIAWHAPTRILLVIEVKTDLPSAEATLRKLDEKTRLARKVAKASFGWDASVVAKLLVMTSSSTLRRRVDRHRSYFAAVLPTRGSALQAWLRRPSGPIAGIWFVSDISTASGIHPRGGRHRVRTPKGASDNSRTDG